MERGRGERAQREGPEKEIRLEKEEEGTEKTMGHQSPGFLQRDEHEDEHRPSEAERQEEKEREGEGEEESAVHVTSNLTAAAASACDILRPLSEVAAQRSILLPTSGSLAWLATHQAGHADRGQKGDGDGSSSSLTHGHQLQSDSIVDATTTTDVSDFDFDGSNTNVLGEFTAAVWRSSVSTTITTASEPFHSTSVYSSSPFSSPPSSAESSSGLIEGFFAPEDQQQQQQPPIPPSPFASIFPEETGTYPLFIQRCDESEMHADPDPSTILKYSESVQLFRRRPEDGGKIWKRRVIEYR